MYGLAGMPSYKEFAGDVEYSTRGRRYLGGVAGYPRFGLDRGVDVMMRDHDYRDTDVSAQKRLRNQAAPSN
jgi:hypothetical protein